MRDLRPIVGPRQGGFLAEDLGGFPHAENFDHFLHVVPVPVIQNVLHDGCLGEIVQILHVPNKIRTFFDECMDGHVGYYTTKCDFWPARNFFYGRKFSSRFCKDEAAIEISRGLAAPFPVEGLVHFAECFICEMGIDLRGGNIRVAEEFLHGADIGTVH